jgi:hypothetical protein
MPTRINRRFTPQELEGDASAILFHQGCPVMKIPAESVMTRAPIASATACMTGWRTRRSCRNVVTKAWRGY